MRGHFGRCDNFYNITDTYLNKSKTKTKIPNG